MPVRGVLGSSYMDIRDDFKTVSNPYDQQEQLAVVPAITPDVSIFHAYQADMSGNILTEPPQNISLLAQATQRAVIVTVEELVGQLDWTPNRSLVPARYIKAIVHAPGGAHPTSCRDYYPIDTSHIREYIKSAKDPVQWKQYLQKYIFEIENLRAYREAVGLK